METIVDGPIPYVITLRNLIGFIKTQALYIYVLLYQQVLFASTLRHLKTEVPSKQSKKTGKKRKSETNGVEDELQNVTKNESSSMPAVSINSNPINETENRRSKRKK